MLKAVGRALFKAMRRTPTGTRRAGVVCLLTQSIGTSMKVAVFSTKPYDREFLRGQ